MCGILAVFNTKKNSSGLPASRFRSDVLNASKLLRHRGPDWNGIKCMDNCIMAHERLSVNGLNSGAQPIVDVDGTSVLAVNGEIYNHLDIRADNLPAETVFTTDSDCEVLLHLYRTHGPAFLEKVKVNGMFAFALYDEVKDEFVVARDHAGIIPLYIGYGPEQTIWVASEMKALFAHCWHFETFRPGHYMVGGRHDGQVTVNLKPFLEDPWFTLEVADDGDGDGGDRGNRLEGLAFPSDPAQLRQKLTESVRSHLMTEVPFGVLLSGGLDSSLIASIASRELRNSKVPLNTFSIGLKGSPDLEAAEEVARFLGTNHHSFTFTVEQGLDALSDVIYHLETFDVTTIRASTPMYLLSRALKATGSKMVLSGEGADEVFAGYLYFHKAPDPEELHLESVRKVRRLHLYDCLRANKASMAWGVEVRVPFLDRKFLEYAMSLDPALKMPRPRPPSSGAGSARRVEKCLLRAAFEDPEGGDPYLPEHLLWRQKEQFSDGVGYGWIDGLKEHAEGQVSDLQMQYASDRFPISTPTTKESYLYRDIFNRHFPSALADRTVPWEKSIACSTGAAIKWDKLFSGSADPSGRSVSGVHLDAY